MDRGTLKVRSASPLDGMAGTCAVPGSATVGEADGVKRALSVPFIVPSLSLTELSGRLHREPVKSKVRLRWIGSLRRAAALPRFVNPPIKCDVRALSFRDAIVNLEEELNASSRIIEFARRCARHSHAACSAHLSPAQSDAGHPFCE